MMTNGLRNSKVEKHVFLGILLSITLLLSGCVMPWSKLDFRSFAQSMRGSNMAVVERDRVGKDIVIPPEWASQGITAWKVAGNKDGTNSLSLQYLEFESEEDSVKFFQSESNHYASAAGNAGARKGNAFSASGNGFFYYICSVGKKVVLGDCQLKDLNLMVKVINAMPEVTGIDDQGKLK